MDNQVISIVILSFVCIFCCNSVCTLRCYSCYENGPYPNTTCSGTVKNCTEENAKCNTYSIKGRDNMYDFTRDCVTDEICKKDYCKTLEEQLQKTNCKIECCDTDLCNRDVIIPTVASFGYQVQPFKSVTKVLFAFITTFVSNFCFF